VSEGKKYRKASRTPIVNSGSDHKTDNQDIHLNIVAARSPQVQIRAS
jgi:hypothetical protein